MSEFSITQVALSLAAVAGLFTLINNLKERRQDPLQKRFLFALRATATLYIGRAFFEVFGGYGGRFIVIISASLIPLAVLLLTEGLLRRHAPPVAKIWAAGGAFAFALSAFAPSQLVDPARITLLMIFQLGVFVSCGWLVYGRDRDDLSATESEIVAKLALLLLLLIPLIFADYLFSYMGLPYQVSAIGILCLCWLSMGLSGWSGSRRAMFFAFAAMAAISLLAALTISAATQINWVRTVEVFAIVSAAVLISKILLEARVQRAQSRSLGLLKHLAQAPLDSSDAFLQGFRGHPALESAVVVKEDDLDDFDLSVLQRLFTHAPVLRGSDELDADAACRDHAQHLFSRYQASHIMKVAEDPLVLVAMTLPGLAVSQRSELELATVQRMAMLAGKQG